MGIERMNPYSQRFTGLSSKAPAESKLQETKKSPPDRRSVEKRISEQEKLKSIADHMKREQSKMKQAEENMKAEQDGMKILMTCLEISRRIVSGDEVPRKDEEYLMEHNMELYARAIMMRRQKEDPYEYDQLSEDEEPAAPQGAVTAAAPVRVESPAPAPGPEGIDVSV